MGEMERDVFVSHGATQVIRDRWLHNSDYYDTVICNTCGSFANKASWTCSVCHDKADLRNVVVPYAAKLLKQELASSGVYLQFSSQQK
jgi:DNA-directed RNA polymerase beta subunit